MKYPKFLITAFACLSALFSCEEPQYEEVVPYIEIDKTKIEATYEGVETTLDIKTNTKWTLTRTDSEGNPIDWVKFNKLSHEGTVKIEVKVEENPDQVERTALITFEAGTEKAFLEVVQAANPNEPVEPEIPEIPDNPEPEIPDDGTKVLRFDFSGEALPGWPTVSDQSLGADVSDLNKALTYNLDGTDYEFMFKCIPSATQAKSFWSVENGYLVIEIYRYLSLPMIEGYAIEKVDCCVGKKSTTAFGYVTSEITTATSVKPAEDTPSQEWNVDPGTVISYVLDAPDPTKEYYLYAGKDKLRVSYIEITYIKSEGGAGTPETPDTPDQPTEPEQPEQPEQPTEPENPETPVTPNSLELEFDFTTEPQEGWPTAKGAADANLDKQVNYNLNGTSYSFILKEAPGSKGEKIYWQYNDNGKYFVLEAQYRYLGLPVLEGYALKTVDCTVGKQVAQTASYVTSSIGGITADTHPTTDTAAQSWNKEPGTVITYDVNSSDATKQYYLYCKSKGMYLSKLKLTYVEL